MKDKLAFVARAGLAFIYDVLAAGLAWIAAYWLRFNLELPDEFMASMWHSLAWVVPIYALVFWGMGLYRGIWRYASLPDLRRIAAAIAISTLAATAVLVMVDRFHKVPRTVLILQPLLLAIIMGGARIAYRSWKDQRLYHFARERGEPVLILGAGDLTVTLLKELARRPDWMAKGILDDNLRKHGRMIQGVRVLGAIDDLENWVQRLKIRQVIIAMPSMSHEARRHTIEVCAHAGVRALTVPAMEDLLSGRVTVAQLRQVEVEDLLGREPVVLDSAGLRDFIAGRVVMVTGAGGSIGSELCRQIARYQPRLLVLFELSEFALYRMEQEFRERFSCLPIACVAGDVKSAARLDQVMGEFGPDVVFHAAAYKHVPLMEQNNAWEAVRNNAWGTLQVARAAIRHGVDKFVLVSTDKAVNPVNVMGASKRMAERVCQALQPKGKTAFLIVRFGNVLDSAGSVIPKFRDQIARGGPVTVTHPEITRYFMSIPEATQLILQAGLMGKGGEVFVLDMGEPVKIVDLARDMIRLSGASEEEVRIVFTGLRPGEKLYEELLAREENQQPTPHPKLRIALTPATDAAWLEEAESWLQDNPVLSDIDCRHGLAQRLPDYRIMDTTRDIYQERIAEEGAAEERG